MLAFWSENIGTVAVGAGLACIVIAIVLKLIRDRKRGGCAGCGHACASCDSGAATRPPGLLRCARNDG